MTGDNNFISVRDSNEKAWQELNAQQGKEVQEKEEVEEGQLQPRQDLPMEESNQEDEVEKESLHPTHIDLDQGLLLYERSENTRSPRSC